MGSVRAAAWGSASAREVVARIAQDVAERSAFGYCAIEVMRSDGLLEYVAVHGGTPQDEQLVGRPVRPSALEPLFALGTVHGELTFVASERCTDAVREGADHQLFVPGQRAGLPDMDEPTGPGLEGAGERPVGNGSSSNGSSTNGSSSHGSPQAGGTPDPGAWQPGDVLAAQLRDDDDRLRAVVHLADPIDGRRRGPDELNALSELLSLVLRIVLTTIEHEELTQRARITAGVREVLRHVDHEVPVPEIVERVTGQLQKALKADTLTIHLREGAGFPTVQDSMVSDELYAEMTRAIERAWRNDLTLIIEPGHVWGDRVLDEVFRDEFGPLLARGGIGEVVLVPISSSGQLLGVLAVRRAAGGERWTSTETDAALEVARDIGRALLNARAHEAELRLHDDLQRLDDYRAQLISTVSHELKNPIGVIAGHLEMMEGRVHPSEDPIMGRSLEAMRRGVDRLSRLINDLLALSRAGDPHDPREKERIDLGELVAEVVDFAQVTAEQAEVRVKAVPPDEGVVVEGDREDLQRTVANLLSNAVKYSDPGDEVSLSVCRDRTWVVVECTDTGIGISEEDQAHLFDEFFRSTNPEAVQRPGTGLGLAILRRVVSRHGGRIQVESELGRGTTFRIHLPCAEGEQADL